MSNKFMLTGIEIFDVFFIEEIIYNFDKWTIIDLIVSMRLPKYGLCKIFMVIGRVIENVHWH